MRFIAYDSKAHARFFQAAQCPQHALIGVRMIAAMPVVILLEIAVQLLPARFPRIVRQCVLAHIGRAVTHDRLHLPLGQLGKSVLLERPIQRCGNIFNRIYDRSVQVKHTELIHYFSPHNSNSIPNIPASARRIPNIAPAGISSL